MIRRWVYTSDETGACVHEFARQVVAHVRELSTRDRTVRVAVMHGDGRGARGCASDGTRVAGCHGGGA